MIHSAPPVRYAAAAFVFVCQRLKDPNKIGFLDYPWYSCMSFLNFSLSNILFWFSTYHCVQWRLCAIDLKCGQFLFVNLQMYLIMCASIYYYIFSCFWARNKMKKCYIYDWARCQVKFNFSGKKRRAMRLKLSIVHLNKQNKQCHIWNMVELPVVISKKQTNKQTKNRMFQ